MTKGILALNGGLALTPGEVIRDEDGWYRFEVHFSNGVALVSREHAAMVNALHERRTVTSVEPQSIDNLGIQRIVVPADVRSSEGEQQWLAGLDAFAEMHALEVVSADEPWLRDARKLAVVDETYGLAPGQVRIDGRDRGAVVIRAPGKLGVVDVRRFDREGLYDSVERLDALDFVVVESTLAKSTPSWMPAEAQNLVAELGGQKTASQEQSQLPSP